VVSGRLALALRAHPGRRKPAASCYCWVMQLVSVPLRCALIVDRALSTLHRVQGAEGLRALYGVLRAVLTRCASCVCCTLHCWTCRRWTAGYPPAHRLAPINIQRCALGVRRDSRVALLGLARSALHAVRAIQPYRFQISDKHIGQTCKVE
jgi:hypothetical protein